jgi:hypothetical protein
MPWNHFLKRELHALAGYFLDRTMESVQIDDSSYFCHRFHLYTHLSPCLERGGFPPLDGGVKNESAFP